MAHHKNAARVLMAFLLVVIINSCDSPAERQALVAGTTEQDSSMLFKLIREDPLPAQLSFMEIRMDPFVFNTDKFPAADFAKPDLVRSALGDYKISTSYYDAAYNQATTAAKNGRYGAVVNVNFASGVKMTRYYTIYRYASGFSRHLDWWRWAGHDPTPVTLSMPPVLGINANAQRRYNNDIGVFVRFGFYEDLLKRPYSARLLAGLQESKPEDNADDIRNDLIVKDRQWWIGLKQKLRPVEGFGRNASGPELVSNSPSSSVLRVNNPAAAQMQPAVTQQLDQVLAEWAKSSGEPFGVVLARNGIIYYQKAFGQRDGVALKLTDQSHIASVNKTLTGILLMMCVERKLVSLDDDISKYFPTLKDVKLAKPITIRNLVNHTSGLPDLTLDELNDLEEVIKPILPFVKTGGAPEYSETGYSLVGKILEIVTGKNFATIMKEWMVDPLKLSMHVEGAASDAFATPMDLAKIGQLLLSKGTYGGVRYFNESTFKEMMPPAAGAFGVGVGARDGVISMGKSPTMEPVIWQRVQAMGFTELYGHGASSGTTFLFSPAQNLVIVMTRNSPGKDFEKYNEQFMKAIGTNIIK